MKLSLAFWKELGASIYPGPLIGEYLLVDNLGLVDLKDAEAIVLILKVD